MKRILSAILLCLTAHAQAEIIACPSPQFTYYGLSSDPKPIQGVPMCALFFETDTTVIYAWNTKNQPGTAANWVGNPGPLVRAISSNVPLQANIAALAALETSNGGTSNRIVAASTSTLVVAGNALIKRLIVTSSTAATIQVFDDVSAPCDTAGAAIRTGAIPLTAGGVVELGIKVTAGLCLLSGAGVLDVTAIYLP